MDDKFSISMHTAKSEDTYIDSRKIKMQLLATCMAGVLNYYKLPSCTCMCDYESLLGEPCTYYGTPDV